MGRKFATPEELDPRHLVFIQHRAAGKSAAESARLAGFAPATCKNAYKLDQMPAVKQELERLRRETAVKTGYDLEKAMAELDVAMEFAKTTENANAYAKCIELRAKLSGLMIDRVDQRNVGSFSINIEGIGASAPIIYQPAAEEEPEPEEPKAIAPPKAQSASAEELAALIDEFKP